MNKTLTRILQTLGLAKEHSQNNSPRTSEQSTLESTTEERFAQLVLKAGAVLQKAELNGQFDESQFYIRTDGTPIEHTQLSICADELRLFELAVKYRGAPQDYFYRGTARQRLGNLLNGTEKIEQYKLALEDFAKFQDEEQRTTLLHRRGTTKANLARLLTGQESKELYQESITDLELEVLRIGDANDYSWLGSTEIRYATTHLQGTEREETLNKAVLHLDTSITIQETTGAHYWRARANEELAEGTTTTPHQKREYLERALKDYQHSYELEEDENVLESIEELKEEITELF